MREPDWKSYIVAEPEPILTPQQCQELIKLGQAEPQSDGGLMTAGHPNKKDYTARKNKVSHIPFEKAPKIYSDILGWMQPVNRNRFGFEGMEMHEAGQYSEYSEGDFYNWHPDMSKEPYDKLQPSDYIGKVRKLTPMGTATNWMHRQTHRQTNKEI